MKFVLIALLFAANTCFAIGPGPATAANPPKAKAKREARGSEARIESDASDYSRPIHKDSFLLGLRAGQGESYDGNIGAGVNAEYLYSNQFGFGMQTYYSGYKVSATLGPITSTTKVTAITVAGLGNFHPPIAKMPKALDPYLTLGLGHTFVSTKVSTNYPAGYPQGLEVPVATAEGSTTFLVASASLRYFFDEHLSGVGTLGLGLNTISFGMDYLF